MQARTCTVRSGRSGSSCRNSLGNDSHLFKVEERSDLPEEQLGHLVFVELALLKLVVELGILADDLLNALNNLFVAGLVDLTNDPLKVVQMILNMMLDFLHLPSNLR